MTSLVAVCENCGRRFASDVLDIDLAASVGGQWSNTAVGTCSTCGGDIVLVDGGIDRHGRIYYVQQVIEALRQPEVTREDVEWLAAALPLAQASPQPVAALAARVETERPALQELLRLLRDPATPTVISLITLLMMVIPYFLHSEPAGITAQDAARIAREVVVAMAKPAAAPAAKPRVATPPARAPKNPRGVATPKAKTQARAPTPPNRRKCWTNARCRCGSGRPARNCHDAPKKKPT